MLLKNVGFSMRSNETEILMITTVSELSSAQKQLRDGSWVPAKPLAAPGMTFWNRIKAAILVLAGKAVAVRWY